ncbi:hypothetical protein E4U13_001476 [Claviceps humidiphila]|uniref:Zn(2)-C6 fungal-type domain-containing protein n=1 Tax=Claviceps humidiphila TaxID=1294629 RepID=A0A9P7Q2K0_9HYPO|nr:hypothetical protein E4U13_001476 [Claviceps humidiphila]
MDAVNPPTKACHNCRKQRLRCDRSYPQCNKCVNSGRVCLGYGKLLRWTGAVATRGKYAGRTSSAPLAGDASPSKSGAASRSAARSAARSAVRSASASTSASVSSSASASESVAAAASSTGSVTGSLSETSENLSVITPAKPESRSSVTPYASPQTVNVGALRYDGTQEDGDVQLVVQSHPRASSEFSLASPWVLVDPLYQDMQYGHRHYLSYFATRVCKDLVSHDLPDRNPFRGLIPLTRAHPLLQHIIVAASASHMSNLVRAPLTSRDSDVGESLRAMIHQASRRALNDALLAKATALGLMRGAVENMKTTGADVILAAALFFINVELIESGKHGWKAHLEGAGRIMSLLQPTMGAETTLRDYMLSDCFIYFIMASAFMPAVSLDSQSYFKPAQIISILRRAAANNYLCSPPEILVILYSASQLSNTSSDASNADEIRDAGLKLLQEAQSFDIDAWANDARNVEYMPGVPIQSRVHAGSAHRLAACLYILQAIPSLAEIANHDEVVRRLSDNIIEHLSCISDEDPNFKATTWPTFIAGAEARDPPRRDWVMNRLKRLVVSCPWGFLYTAMDTLQSIWDLDGKVMATKSWVQLLKDPDLNFLIV